MRIAAAAVLAGLSLSAAQVAQAKPFEDYLKPTPIVCPPLSSASWGVAGVLPRDLSNGIESAKGAGVHPDYYYWDGQIIKATDGKYHMFMSTLPGLGRIRTSWTNSDAYHAVSQTTRARALRAARIRVHQQRLAQRPQRLRARASGRYATRSSSARSFRSRSTSRALSTVRGRRVRASYPTNGIKLPATTPTGTPTSASSRATTASSKSCSATGPSRSRTPCAAPT